jgi:hypothetical protein
VLSLSDSPVQILQNRPRPIADGDFVEVDDNFTRKEEGGIISRKEEGGRRKELPPSLNSPPSGELEGVSNALKDRF